MAVPASDTEPEVKRGPLRRVGNWLNERTHLYDGILPIIQHPVPADVNWWYVFGSATLFTFIVQVVTGVALAMTYVPATNSVYQSLQFITNRAPFGSLLRGMHYWGASAMVLMISCHIIRVFLMGSFKYPRELNWLTGVFLFALTAAMGFSGQLLRWDQFAYWSVVIAAEQAAKTPVIGNFLAQVVLGGHTVGGATLTRFFATHVFLLPALLFMFIGVHLYLVILDGISELPRPGQLIDPKTYKQWYENLLEHHGEPFFPDAAWKDALFGFIIVGAIVAVAAIVGPPKLEATVNPAQVLTYPRPEWYFIWYFAVLALIPPQIENYVILGVPLLLALLMIAVPFVSNRGERAPSRRPWTVGIVACIIVMVSALSVVGFEAPWSPIINAAQILTIPTNVMQRLQGDQIAGAQVFRDKGCITCHAIEGEGGSRGPDLTTIADRYNRGQMVARIENGAPNMPSFAGNISNEQLQQLVDFLETLHSPSQRPAGAG